MTEQRTNEFGYELLRDHVLPTVLGKHEADILYWVGKDIARKFPMFSMEETTDFFKEAAWGDLQLLKQTKEEATYELKGLDHALKISERNFRLEAGFLAQTHEKLSGYLTECIEEKQSADKSVRFFLKWDRHSIVEK
ncbi:YslB family protein [Paenisporosarcina cavernae]